MKRIMISLFFLLTSYSNALAQVIENPVFDRTDIPKFHIDKVEITSDTTFVYCTYLSDASSWANISEDTYLISYPSKKKHKILTSVGLPFSPEKKEFQYSQTFDVLLCFPSIQGSNHFDLIENPVSKAFNVYGVSLVQQSRKRYQETELNRLLNMSSFYESSGDSIKAIQYKKEEIEAAKNNYGIQSDITFFSLLGLCVLYDKYGFSKETINTIQYISKVQKESWGKNSLEFVMQNRAFAENNIFVSYYDKIIDAIQRCRVVYDKLKIVDYGYAIILRNLADYYLAIGDEQNFIHEQKNCLEIRKKQRDEGLFLEDLLILFIRNATPDVYEERLNILEKEIGNLPNFVDKQSHDYAYFLSILLPVYRMTENHQKSLNISNEILSILEKDKIGNANKIVEIQEGMTNSLIRIKKWHEAIIIGEKSKKMCDSLQIRSKNYYKLLSNLADCYKESYDYEKAIPIMKELVGVYEKEEEWLLFTSSLYEIGNYFLGKEDLDASEVYIRKALEIINLHDKAEEYLIKDVVNNPYAVGDPNRSLINYNNMILSVKATSYTSLGFVLERKDSLEKAIDCELIAGELMKEKLKKYAVDDMTKRQDLINYAYHLLSLSGYYTQNNQYRESCNCARESIDYFKRCEFPDSYRAYTRLSYNYCYTDLDSALYYAKEALEVSNAFNNAEGKQGCLSLLATILRLKQEYNKAEEYLSEAIDYMQNNIKSEIVRMTNEQKQRLWKKNESDFLLYRDIIAKCDWNGQLNSKLLNYTLFSKSLLLDTDSMNTDLANRRMTIIWKDIQKKLSNKDIAIEFLTTREYPDNKTYFALVVNKNCEYPNMITLFKESDLGELKQNSRKSVLEKLGNLIWKPILDQYEQIENIYFSPDGLLHIYPIEYCNVDGIGEMMEHFNMYRLSSTKEILFQVKELSNSHAILYGGLNYDNLSDESNSNLKTKEKIFYRSINKRGGFDQLSSTLEEVNEIGSLLNEKNVSTSLYTGNNGTEESFKNLSGRDVGMLHLSTHGMYVEPDSVEQKKKRDNYEFLRLIINDKDPVKEDIVLTHSFLVMSGGNKLSHRETIGSGSSDGILTASEISQVDLSKTDIVVLSACETGLGDVENGGVYGLQRGFKKAGANTILMSLDKVDDEATKILMVEFYKNLMNGKTKHQSLKEAQKYLRKVDNCKFDKPEYWASFILLDGIN